MTSAFPPQLAALATGDLAHSALPQAPVRPAQPAKPSRRPFRRKLRASSPRNEPPRESERLALDLQALVDAGLIEFRDGPGVRRYVLSPRGLELTVGL
jgi:hypothetical protein